MSRQQVTEDVFYIGVNDRELDLFEGQYRIPQGVSYNSYLIFDEKIAVLDTTDKRKTKEWLENLKEALEGRKPDYLIVSHLEPDHGAGIQAFLDCYPDAELVGNAKTFAMLGQFFELDKAYKQLVVKEGTRLSLGKHTLVFSMAPMVHWPEVMVTYEETEKLLFSADGFGTFGVVSDTDITGDKPVTDWAKEARRYYINIVGKYGAPVQALLKKAAGLDIRMICPLHGPLLRENLSYYVEKYRCWSSYEPEEEGVFIAYASMHGNTAAAAELLAELLAEKATVVLCDLARCDLSEAVAEAFRYDRLVVAAPTYDGGLFPVMEDFLRHLKAKNYQKRKVGIIENGSWAALSGKWMRELLGEMKELTVTEPVVTVLSTVKPETREQLAALAKALTK